MIGKDRSPDMDMDCMGAEPEPTESGTYDSSDYNTKDPYNSDY